MGMLDWEKFIELMGIFQHMVRGPNLTGLPRQPRLNARSKPHDDQSPSAAFIGSCKDTSSVASVLDWGTPMFKLLSMAKTRQSGPGRFATKALRQLVVEEREHSNLIFPRGRDQRGSLTIEVTEKGPVLRFDGPALEIQTTGPLSVNAETLSLYGCQGLILSSGGSAEIRVTGDLNASARIQNIRAELGNVNVTANDRVRLVGERVLLNC